MTVKKKHFVLWVLAFLQSLGRTVMLLLGRNQEGGLRTLVSYHWHTDHEIQLVLSIMSNVKV